MASKSDSLFDFLWEHWIKLKWFFAKAWKCLYRVNENSCQTCVLTHRWNHLKISYFATKNCTQISKPLCAGQSRRKKNRSQKIKSTKNVMPKANKKKATALLWNIHIVIPVFHEIIKSLIPLCVPQLAWLMLLCSCRNADHSSLLFRH